MYIDDVNDNTTTVITTTIITTTTTTKHNNSNNNNRQLIIMIIINIVTYVHGLTLCLQVQGRRASARARDARAIHMYLCI